MFTCVAVVRVSSVLKEADDRLNYIRSNTNMIKKLARSHCSRDEIMRMWQNYTGSYSVLKMRRLGQMSVVQKNILLDIFLVRVRWNASTGITRAQETWVSQRKRCVLYASISTASQWYYTSLCCKTIKYQQSPWTEQKTILDSYQRSCFFVITIFYNNVVTA